MDLPQRTKLLTWFIAVALVGGVLTFIAGSLLINQAVMGEQRRRVALALRTARAMLDLRMDEALKVAGVAGEFFGQRLDSIEPGFLENLRTKLGCDYLQIVDEKGRVAVTARGKVARPLTGDDPIIAAVLRQGSSNAGLRLVSAEDLALEDPMLAARARVRLLPTPNAPPPETSELSELSEGLVLEAAAPIVRPAGGIIGAVRVGVLLNGNSDLVDFVRSNVFSTDLYKGKMLGAVTLYQRNVRIATNVVDREGQRAIGTLAPAEVQDRVLGRGETWIGPALAVDTWYLAGYEPLRSPANEIIGILSVGVLKERYDDMRRQAMRVFGGIAALALLVAFAVANWRATKLARPLGALTEGVVAVAAGNLDHQLPEPEVGERDELRRLTGAFLDMVEALRQRDAALQASHLQLAQTAEELRRWNHSYQEALGFITHELKNQVAAMKINLLALRDGYVGPLGKEQQEAVGDVADAIARTEDMIANYLNLSRIEKGDLEVRARPVQVAAEVVEVVLRDLRGRFAERQMRVEVDLAEDLVAQADPALLQIVYENLLSNAAKYGRQGGLVRLFGGRTESFVELHVWNEGEGVPPDQTQALFEKFSRLRTAEERERGTGLGLFITREIVLKLGGAIRVESEYGRWVDFIFTLPRPDIILEDA